MLAVLASVLLLAPLGGASKVHVDKGGAFALNIPDGYTAERMDFGDGLALTEIGDPNKESGPMINVLTQKSAEDIDPANHKQVADAVFEFVGGVLAEDGEVTSRKRSETTFGGRKASREDMTFKDGDGVTWKGWITVVCGKRNVVAVMPHAPSSDSAGWKLVEDHALSLAVESSTPGSGAAPKSGGGILNKEALSSAAGKIRGNFKRDSMDKVIVAGDPPLTYGSVANFVTVMELLFDMQFTETEFEATRERFVEYYNKQDAEGKRILALQGAELLKSATQGTAEEVAQSRVEGRAVFENAFKLGAEQGMGYAQVMWDAITRRSNKLATAKGQPKKDDWDQEISEADIDATLEMLYFMWVAAGRDASDVTPEDVMRIRNNIIQELPEMDPQLQLVIANAPKVYAGMRQMWQSATLEQRVMLSQQYGGALDQMGLKEGGSFEQSSGGGGNGETLAAIAQNTAWNAAKTWTTTSN